MVRMRAIGTLGLILLSCGGSTGQSGEGTRREAVSASSIHWPVVTQGNSSGASQTMNASGGHVLDTGNPFFQPLGTNGRSCSTCHVASDGMTITPEGVQARFDATGGTDPVFRPNDGSTSPLADVSTVDARRSAYGLLLHRAVIRVGLPIPEGAEFALDAVQDPYGYASAKELSLFRRPLPATNLRFLSTVMADGRATLKDPSQPSGFAPSPTTSPSRRTTRR